MLGFVFFPTGQASLITAQKWPVEGAVSAGVCFSGSVLGRYLFRGGTGAGLLGDAGGQGGGPGQQADPHSGGEERTPQNSGLTLAFISPGTAQRSSRNMATLMQEHWGDYKTPSQ